MTLKTFLSINGIMFVPFGVLMLTLPSKLFPMLGLNLAVDGLVMASMVGSMLLSFGVICWLGRKGVSGSVEMRALLVGNFLFHTIDSFLTAKAAFLGDMYAIGYVFSSMHLVFALLFLYYIWVNRTRE